MAKANFSEKIKDFMESKNGRSVTIGLIVIISLVIVLELYVVLTPRVPPVEQSSSNKEAVVQKETPEDKTTEDASSEEDSFEIYLIKDPFEPLVKPQSDDSGSGSTSGGEESQSTLTLKDIYTEDSTKYTSIDVGETNYKVKEGDTFATNYKVVTIGTDSVTLLYGDETINLEIGSSISK
ncbi:MAG: hypothetical protein HY776_02160 [Actinobacteria bacterium]|nr:hypothetical protein [Actinomycetota bacterium]